MNSKLLKEAIADAKAVRETALANAKIALEEAFTPRLQSILTQKLRAEAEMEDDAEKVDEELDSTNNFVKLNVSNLENGAIIVAERQTRGRGLRDNQWYSDFGNLYFSFIIKDNVYRSNLFTYIVQSSVSIIKTLKQFGINAEIKYPNDCLVESKKITGILNKIKTTRDCGFFCIIIHHQHHHHHHRLPAPTKKLFKLSLA